MKEYERKKIKRLKTERAMIVIQGQCVIACMIHNRVNVQSISVLCNINCL